MCSSGKYNKCKLSYIFDICILLNHKSTLFLGMQEGRTLGTRLFQWLSSKEHWVLLVTQTDIIYVISKTKLPTCGLEQVMKLNQFQSELLKFQNLDTLFCLKEFDLDNCYLISIHLKYTCILQDIFIFMGNMNIFLEIFQFYWFFRSF